MTDPTALPNLPGFGGPAAPQGANGAPPAEAPLTERLTQALTDLELSPTTDADGDLTFVFQDQQLFIRASDDEAQVVRIFGQWRLAEPVPDDENERLAACNDVNIAFNMIKTAIAEDTLLVTTEHMIPRGADVRSLLMVAIPLVLHGVSLWHQRAIGEEAMAQMAQEQEQGTPDADTQNQGAQGPGATPTTPGV